MNTLLYKIRLYVTGIMLLLGSCVWAAELTITPSQISGAVSGTATFEGFSFTASKANGLSAPVVNATYGDLRVYANGTFRIQSDNSKITKIVFTLSTQGKRRLAPITSSVGTIATQQAGDETVTWTGSAYDVILTVGSKADYGSDGSSKAGQFCFDQIVVTTEDGGVNPSGQTLFTFSTSIEPSTVGSVTPASSRQLPEGATIECSTVANANSSYYTFLHWIADDNTVVSTERSFTYTMPDHDVTLTAVYEYNPATPGNPNAPTTPTSKYTVTLKTSPSNAGTFSWNTETQVATATSCDIYAYANTGFVFREWQRDGETVSTSFNYKFQMPEEDVALVAVYEYNPANPGNPSKGYWDETTGEVIIDDFSAGGLGTAINNCIGGSTNRSKVKMITVSGIVNQSDWGILNNHTNCDFLDMGRTGGLTYVPSYNFSGNTALQTIILPASIESISNYAFQNCSQLSVMDIHAVTPPTVATYAFNGVTDLVVHVPADAVALYQEAPVWKDFTILPLGDDVSALEVNMPENVNMSLYKDMFLELINTKSGQKLRYVLTNRTTYTFNSLIHRTNYNVYLKNAQGYVLGEIDNVDIIDQDVSVTFDKLLSPRTLSLTVETPDGGDVSDEVSITWMDEKGNFLCNGNTLERQMEGTTVKYRVTLPQDLAMEYFLPVDVEYEVADANSITYTLTAIPQTTISGKVIDAKSGNPLSGATVAVSQMLNGLYSVAYTIKTDASGVWSQTVYQTKTDVTASLTDYVSQTQSYEVPVAEVPTFELKDINGTTILLNLTYTNTEGETQNFYSDYANVIYSVFNQTTGQQITNLNVQYPQIVLMESLPEGTELKVVAESKSQKFMPVTSTASVDNRDVASVTLPIVQLGGITASFRQTDNNSVAGILYDGNGRLVKKYNYDSATLAISELQDGEYTLVTMGHSHLLNSVAVISYFADAGLKEGVEYVKNKVTVESGEIALINNQQIPYLDESRLYFTGANTAIAVNKSQVNVGQYLTLSSHIDFKDMYANRVSDVKLIIDLPQEVSFVDNSVMAGSNMTGYTYDEHKLTVPLVNYNDRIRFCFIPTVGGTFTATANLQFIYDGKLIIQPIGDVNFSVKNLSIIVPSTVASTRVPVSGTGVGKSSVEIYDNGILVGQTTSLSNGSWATTVELSNPYNLSKHDVCAKLTTDQGVGMMSESQIVFYDRNAIQLSKVVMYHNNPEMQKTYEIVFDFINPTTVAQQYIYYIYNKNFTFTIDFTENDPTLVSDVVLFVKLGNDSWVPVETSYDKSKKCWVATAEFGNMYDGILPKNVAVKYNCQTPIYYNYEDVASFLESPVVEELQGELEEVDSLFAANIDIVEDEKINTILSDAVGMEYIDAETINYNNLSEDLLNDKIDEIIDRLIGYDFSSFIVTPDETAIFSTDDYSFDNGKLSGITRNELIDRGYVAMPINGRDTIYVLRSENKYGFADFLSNTIVEISYLNGQKNRRASGELPDDFGLQVADFILNDDVLDKMLEDRITDVKNFCKDWKEASQQIKEFRRLGLDKPLRRWEEKKGIIENTLKGAVKDVKYIKYLKGVGKIMPFLNAGLNYYDWHEYNGKVNAILKKIPSSCSNSDETYSIAAINSEADLMKANLKAYYACNFGVSHVSGALAGLAAAAFPPSVLATFPAMVYAQIRADDWFKACCKSDLDRMESAVRRVRRRCGYKDEDKNHGQESGNTDADIQIDPSGYVYEAVSSNRVQGATASVYYKETVEDMYGDLHENIVLWNAEEYAQQNPLFTDENGMYRWDVPQGLWQVKFEKEGYETTYSEWLPVPPPQLDVNIAMRQFLQPTVKNVKAYADGIEMEFDKYMDPETLTPDNILVTKNGNAVNGVIKLLNEEVAYEGQNHTYASKVRFEVPEDEQLLTTDEVQLTVRRAVKSYAGTPMENDYTQQFDVELQVRNVVVDSLINVAYGGQRTIMVAALPVDAAKGKTISVKSLSNMIAKADVETLTLDENGQAELTVTGELPGATAMSFAVDGTDVKRLMTVNVKDAANLVAIAPRASRVSGTEVYRGTQIRLTSETENATIYYTLDGSCPCDLTSESVIKYNPDEPIIIADDNVIIKAMATGHDLGESDVAEFTYSLKKSTLGYQMPTGWSWISHNLEEPVPTTSFQTNVERIVSQTAEQIYDPTLGFVGNLNELQPVETYKVKVSAPTENRLSGYEFNAVANSLNVAAGWNWLGYPLNQTMSLPEAFAFFTPSEGDYIVGQDGFAEFSDSEWHGTLEGMVPGKGYMYKSATESEIMFNTTIVSEAGSKLGKRNLLGNSPWSYDKNAYQNIMPVIAELYDGKVKVDDGEYTLGAFSGTECRGIAQWKDGRLMLSVYGDGDEPIRFIAADKSGENYYDIQESLTFEPDNKGTWRAPMKLTIGQVTTDISDLYGDLVVSPVVFRDHISVSVDGRKIGRLTLTNMLGVNVMDISNIGTAGTVTTTGLADGVYVLMVQAEGRNYYKKIMKASK